VVKNWAERWARRREKTGALAYLAISRDANSSPCAFGRYLKSLAKRARMDYLAPQEWVPYPVKLAMEITSANKMTPELDSLMHPHNEIRDWGIND
ncbi:MAG: hypothetical protein AB1705_18120, partial [Verrucomicrobiota bacterium]